jgi:tRNA nucleotidyltransferase (CCA-adding enzyme)
MREALSAGMVLPEQIRRWAAHAGRPAFPLLIRLADARWSAFRVAGLAAPSASATRRFYAQGVRSAYREPIALADLAVDGDDLVGAGIAPGPAIGQILSGLLDAVLEDPSRNTRETLLALVRQKARG